MSVSDFRVWFERDLGKDIWDKTVEIHAEYREDNSERFYTDRILSLGLSIYTENNKYYIYIYKLLHQPKYILKCFSYNRKLEPHEREYKRIRLFEGELIEVNWNKLLGAILSNELVKFDMKNVVRKYRIDDYFFKNL